MLAREDMSAACICGQQRNVRGKDILGEHLNLKTARIPTEMEFEKYIKSTAAAGNIEVRARVTREKDTGIYLISSSFTNGT